MALVDADQIEALVETIVPALPSPSNSDQETARTNAVNGLVDLFTKQFQYQVEKTQVQNVETKLDTRLFSIFSAGAPIPTDGGTALQIAWKAATLSATVDLATQFKDGTIK